MKKFLQLSFLPVSTDGALLLLRLWYGLPMLILHGWPKMTKFAEMAGQFPDPLGVGPRNSLILALVGEVLCSVLLVLGLFTRFAALVAALTMAVAFGAVHGFALTGERNGEMAYVYLGVFIALFFAGLAASLSTVEQEEKKSLRGLRNSRRGAALNPLAYRVTTPTKVYFLSAIGGRHRKVNTRWSISLSRVPTKGCETSTRGK